MMIDVIVGLYWAIALAFGVYWLDMEAPYNVDTRKSSVLMVPLGGFIKVMVCAILWPLVLLVKFWAWRGSKRHDSRP